MADKAKRFVQINGNQVLPTRKVKVTETGHVCTINKDDFDPNVHEDPDGEQPVAKRTADDQAGQGPQAGGRR
jgi:hypothetical protein